MPDNDILIIADQATDTAVIAALRAQLMQGLVTPAAFGQVTDRAERTVRGWMREGLPTRRIGRSVFIDGPAGVEWVLRRSNKSKASRPRK